MIGGGSGEALLVTFAIAGLPLRRKKKPPVPAAITTSAIASQIWPVPLLVVVAVAVPTLGVRARTLQSRVP